MSFTGRRYVQKEGSRRYSPGFDQRTEVSATL